MVTIKQKRADRDSQVLNILALYILFSVRYRIKSINKYVYHLIDIHIPHSLKKVLLLKLTAGFTP